MFVYFLKRAFGRVWFMALILKISTSKKSREFKSHSARSNQNHPKSL